MGIRGLTTFIENRSHLYFEKYQLHSTSVVIDGNAIACQLYKWHCKSNDCFGGDYDKYADVITNFFQMLSDCNVTPYIILDGGYEARKIATIISRMKNKIKSAQQLNSTTEGSISVFPLFLRELFLDIVLKLNVPCVRCDFESDTEVARIARLLDCPVMSYDSDFFILDVLYIPFSTVEMNARKKKVANSKDTYNYISCKVYKVEKFLKSFGGMDKNNLPILATLLGNDYVERRGFSRFYQNLKMQKCHGNQNEQQVRIKSLIMWLQNETVESAIRKVLSRYKYEKRKSIAVKIKNSMEGYNYGNSDYVKYLGISVTPPKAAKIVNVEDIANDIDEEPAEIDEAEESNSEDEGFSLSDEHHKDIPKMFIENYRKCLYPPSFMDILLHSKYYCIPQVENYLTEYSHAVSSEILTVIHKILTNSSYNMVCIARNENGDVKKYVLPQCNVDVPSFIEIQSMSLVSRKKLLMKVFEVDESFVENCLNLFAESWQLFIITLKYLRDKSVITWPLTYSLVLCAIFLNCVDAKVGLYRSSKLFDKKFGTTVQDVLNKKPEISNNYEDNIMNALKSISYNDSLVCLKTLISYFQIDIKMKTNYRLFDRKLVHTMAQFQSCFLHVKYINSLLNYPFPNFIISNFFSGTFIYNLTTNFMKRSNLDDYIRILLQNSTSILHCYKLIVAKLREHCKNDSSSDTKISNRRRRKRKHKEISVTENEDPNEEEEKEEFIFDPNNIYSILSVK